MAAQDITTAVQDAADNDGILVGPTAEIAAAVSVVSTGHLRVLMTNDEFRTLTDDFILATELADQIQEGTVEVRTTDDVENRVLVTNDSIVQFLSTEDGVWMNTNGDTELAGRVYRASEGAFEEATEPSLRVPPRSDLVSTMKESLGSSMADSFERVLDQRDELSRSADLDEVATVILLAATEETLLYDVSKWGEDVGLASKATFSRVKTQLEDGGYIATEKVPIDVGRPRLRLKVAEDSDLQTVNQIVEAVGE